MIGRGHEKLSISRQCGLLGVNRSSYYHQPMEPSEEDLELMKLIDHEYLKTPFYGSRKMAELLGRLLNRPINRKRVQRLMRLMGIEAIYQKPNTSRPGKGHKIYPYLLKGLEINRPGMVFAADITYIPMRRGFLYLVAVMDWFSRYVLAWRLSNTLEPISAWRPWKRLWTCKSLISSTWIRDRNSPAQNSPACCWIRK